MKTPHTVLHSPLISSPVLTLRFHTEDSAKLGDAYQISEVATVGGLHKAVHKDSGLAFGMKFLPLSGLTAAVRFKARTVALQEAIAWGRVSCEAVVHLQRVYVEPHRAALVLQYSAGGSVEEELLRQSILPPRTARGECPEERHWRL